MSGMGDGLALELGVDLTANIGRTLDAINGKLDRLNPIPPQAPVFYRMPRNGTVTAAGTVSLRLHGPDQGHLWYVRSITCGGLAPSTVTPGAADVFILAGNPGQTLEPSLLDWRDQASRLPSIAFYGKGELEVRANEQVWVRFSGCTPEQVVTAVVQVEDIQEGATLQSWGL